MLKITHLEKPEFELRWYQTEAVDAFFSEIKNGVKSTLISAPTGSGKSLMMAEITRRCVNADKQVLVCTHRKELILQDEETLKKLDKKISTGVISASCKRKEFDAQSLYAGIMTVIRNLDKLPKIDVLLVDECHHISPNENTSYQKLVNNLKENNPELIVGGFSATPYRIGQGLLTEGDDRLFDSMCYEVDIEKLTSQKYLCDMIARGSDKVIDTKKLHTKMGDFDKEELAIAADNEALTEHVVNEICELAKDRKSWIIFTTSLAHSEHVLEKLIKKNINAKIVDGDTPNTERDKILTDFKSGVVRCVINVGVLTEGFDAKNCDCVVLLTATKSPNKYVQMLGRGLRISPEKENCLVLDYGENIVRLGFLADVKPPRKGKQQEPKKVKECPKCHTFVRMNTKICPECGNMFGGQVRKLNHVAHSYEGDVIGKTFTPHWTVVKGVSYSIHKKIGRPDTFKITYTCDDNKSYCKFLSLSAKAHPYAYDQSYRFVTEKLGGKATSIEEASFESDKWKKPSEIFVTRTDDGFFEIKQIRFGESMIPQSCC